MRRRTIISAVIGVLTLLAGPAAIAQPAPAIHAEELIERLDAHTFALGRERYALAAGPLTGVQARGQTQRFTIRLWAGQDYVFAAACDSNCTDLDLRIIDPRDAIVGAEADGAAAPMVRISPNVTGQHVIEATLPRCRTEQCWFAVNVYAR